MRRDESCWSWFYVSGLRFELRFVVQAQAPLFWGFGSKFITLARFWLDVHFRARRNVCHTSVRPRHVVLYDIVICCACVPRRQIPTMGNDH